MRSLKRMFTTILIVAMTVMMLTTVAFAAEGNEGGEALTEADRSAISSGITINNGVISGTGALTGASTYFTTVEEAGEGAPIEVSGGKVWVKKGQSATAHIAISQGTNSNSQAGNLQSQMFQTTANINGANTMLRGAMPYINLVIGLIIVVVTAGMTFFSACDICYIAFPVFRNKCEEAKMKGGTGTGKGANGETILKFVTQDAQYAVQEGNLENGKSPWSIYFGKRVASYIFLAIVIFILMTNNISLITQLALNLVSGVMDVIQGLAAG